MLDPDGDDWPGLAASADWVRGGVAYDPSSSPASRVIRGRQHVVDGEVVETFDGPREALFDCIVAGEPGTPPPEACDALVTEFAPRFAAHEPGDHRGQRARVPADHPVAATVLDTVVAANRRWWRFDITAWEIQIAEYRTGCMMELHCDNYPTRAAQKLSATVQLSDPDSYKGGDLLLDHRGTHRADNSFWSARDYWTPLEQGTVAVWPAWTAHQVRRVVAGVRFALVVWGWGPAFR